jgi:hypothetical protein
MLAPMIMHGKSGYMGEEAVIIVFNILSPCWRGWIEKNHETTAGIAGLNQNKKQDILLYNHHIIATFTDDNSSEELFQYP